VFDVQGTLGSANLRLLYEGQVFSAPAFRP
jgi:hypothetical protein